MIGVNSRSLITWRLELPGEWWGVDVRAGHLLGPSVPAKHSALSVAGTPWPWRGRTGTRPARPAGQPLLAVRSRPQPAGPMTLTVDLRDVRAVVGAVRHVTLLAVTHGRAGHATQHLTLDVLDRVVTGDAEVILSANGTWLLTHALSGGVQRIAVAYEDGGPITVHSAPAALPGMLPLPPGRTPRRVIAIDDHQNTSGNILSAVLPLTDLAPSRTPFSPWPFDGRELNPQRPALAGLLGAFEAGLDIHPERAGDALRLDVARDAHLTALAAEFGLTRQSGEGDAQLRARVRALLEPGPATAGGLARTLAAHGLPGAQILDEETTYPGLHYLDGTWNLDGSVLLGGEMRGPHVRPGEITVAFPESPPSWEAVERHTRRKAAGVRRSYAVIDHSRTTALHLSGARHAVHAPQFTPVSAFGIIQVKSTRLNLDGTWNLDGSEVLDGERAERTTYM